jgi:hypothetical protein
MIMIIGRDMEGSARGLILGSLDINLGGLRKTTANFSQDIRSPSRGLNRGTPEYEAGVLYWE